MEVPNKKTIISTFLGVVLLQVVFLLALGANFLLAETFNLSNVNITVEVENNQTTLSDTKQFYASSGSPLESLTFYFDNTNTSVVDDYSFKGTSSDFKKWSTKLDTRNLPNAQYKFYAKGFYNNMPYSSQNSILVDINNKISVAEPIAEPIAEPVPTTPIAEPSSITPLTITFIEKFTPPLFGDQRISISANKEIDSCMFKIEGPKFAQITGVRDNSTQCHILLRTLDFPNGLYIIRAITSSGTATAEISLDAKIENQAVSAPTEPYAVEPKPAPIPAEPMPIEPAPVQPIPIKPYPVEPIKPLEPAPIKPLSSEPVPTKPLSTESIQPIPPTESIPQIPPECKEKGLSTPEECQKYMQIPFECRQQNILDFAKCKEYMFKYAMPPECQKQGATTQEECSRIIFVNSFPSECRERRTTTKEECDKILATLSRLAPECKNANIATIEECDKYMMENFMPLECQKQGATTKEECDYILRNSYSKSENLTKAEIKPTSGKIQPAPEISPGENLPSECSKMRIKSFEECEKYIVLLRMPPECREANITSEEECEKIMFKKFGPPECVEAQILQPEECEKFMFKKYAPEDCKEAGVLNPEACKKYMFEKYSGKENIPEDKLPIECQKAKVKTADECEKVMKQTYMPKECKDQGISSEEECDFYLKQKHMPQECREQEAKSQQECDRIMFDKFSPPECQKAGIENEKECQEFMFNKYAPKVKCDNLEDWQCKNLVKEKHMGNIVAKQTEFDKIKERSAEIIGKSIEAKELKSEMIQEKIMSIAKEDVKLKVMPAAESLVLNEENSLIQTAPVALAIDTDKDGLPDDIETRLGTDPFNADTDEDGQNDGDEVKNNSNPIGEGKLEKEMAPIEEAIIQNKALGHPKTEGEEKESLAVKDIVNVEDKANNTNKGYILSGKSEPDSVTTLYIYSDLPVVITVKADEYGNWKYELAQSLVEGEHEVYVAINDNTGKVISKSKPLNFFVKEAKAISVKEFVTPIASAASQTPKKSESLIQYYLIVSLALMVIGIFLFIAVIVGRKKGRDAK